MIGYRQTPFDDLTAMIDTKIFHKSKSDRTIYYMGDQPLLEVGCHTYMGEVRIVCYDKGHGISIGKYCSIANDVEFALVEDHALQLNSTFPFEMIWPDEEPRCRRLQAVQKKPRRGDGWTIVGNDVWVGRGANILSGVKIGDGAVIGARCVVSKNIPAYAVVVGNPCRVIRHRFDEIAVGKFEEMQWWNWPLQVIRDNLEVIMSRDVDALYAVFKGMKSE